MKKVEIRQHIKKYFPSHPDVIIDKATELIYQGWIEDEKMKASKILSKVYVTRSFHLTEKEEKEYRESGAKQITFIEGGGIGTKVIITNEAGGVRDITDYEKW